MKPKILTTLPSYTRVLLVQDAIAGVTVAMVALPLSLAIAIASGADPSKGLITAIVAGFLISLLGGSRVQIGGPTGAFIVVVFGVVVEEYKREGFRLPSRGVFFFLLGALFLCAKPIHPEPPPPAKYLPNRGTRDIATSQLKDLFVSTSAPMGQI